MDRERIFLGWDRPALWGAVAFLYERYGPRTSGVEGAEDLTVRCKSGVGLEGEFGVAGGGCVWDMRDVVVVVPVARAGRRLLELLVQKSEQALGTPTDPESSLINGCKAGGDVVNGDGLTDRCKSGAVMKNKAKGTGGFGGSGGGGLFPPRIVTVGELPEMLYEPERGLVDRLRGRLARMAVLKEAEGDLLSTLMGSELIDEGEDGGLKGWGMAEQFEKLSSDLAAGRLRASDVLEKCDELALDLGGEGAYERWASIGELDEAYHAKLKEMGLSDRQHERLVAIEQERCRFKGDLVLVGIADQNAMLNAMIKQAAEAEGDGKLSVLIHCDQGHGQGFDEVGGLDVKYWEKQGVLMGDEQLRFVEKESDLGGEVVRVVSELGMAKGGKLSADAVTVGLCDEGMAGEIGRAMGLAGLPVRYAGGKPMMWSGPVVLLGALGKYAEGRRWEDFAAVARHADFEQYVREQCEMDASNDELGEVERYGEVLDRLLVKLDLYASKHLQGRVSAAMVRDDGGNGVVARLRELVEGLLPEGVDEARGVGEWGKAIAKMMQRVYGGRELKRYDERDEPTYQVLKGIGKVLRDMVGIEAQEENEQKKQGGDMLVTFSEAVGLVMGQLKEAGVPPLGGDRAVELMGTLDLQMDDAWGLVVTGFNEGKLPASRNADAFLPDGLRRGLGLMDNGRRYARDVMMVNALIRSRGGVRFIAAKKTAEGDPLMPSRLMLACDDGSLVKRVMGFYQEGHSEGEDEIVLLRAGRDEHGFLVPRPEGGGVDRLYVTGFRDYLACPYRFYLKHVARLGRMSDEGVELDGAGFGTLAHKVLELFGRDAGIRDSKNAAEISGYLSDRLDELVVKWYGKFVRAAVRVQVEQLRERLMVFAGWQATRAQLGWKVRGDLVEWRHEMKVMVDGEAFTVIGKIDRIDEDASGKLCLIDYKTGDAGREPSKTHQRGGEWVDLQLPMYVEMVKDAGLVRGEAGIEVGYMCLPRRLEDTGLKLAKWNSEDLAEAMGVRDDVIRHVSGGVFWPPVERRGAAFEDGYERLVGDRVFDWEALIARSGEVK